MLQQKITNIWLQKSQDLLIVDVAAKILKSAEILKYFAAEILKYLAADGLSKRNL